MIEDYEKEPNNSIEDSNWIETNVKYRGRLSSRDDVDHYKFSLENRGRCYIEFEHNKIDTGNQLWNIVLSGNNSDDILWFYSTGREAIKVSDTVRLPAGEYFLKVKPNTYDESEYSFTIFFDEENEAYEKETNNTIEEATNINWNTEYTGNIQSDQDKDYYKLNTETKGKVSIKFNHNKVDSQDSYWKITLLDGISDEEVIEFLCTGRNAEFQSDNVRIPNGVYYMRISPFVYNNMEYTFTVNFSSEDEQYESEKNNEFDQANEINIYTPYIGNIQGNGDVDYSFLVQ